ncbi:MAG: tripartite tricarboxylate transporter permease, partial [Ruminiclostridium sp.]|nr:tripartite tricarboxylate transporter permease [Ruminiclostridium sp.]
MLAMIQEWGNLPEMLTTIFTSPVVLVTLFLGVVLGYIIGVIPGLGATMGMALVLGLIYRMPQIQGLALLIGILVGSMSSGGITASLANIPGTSAAAATVMDGYPMTLKGKGREATGYAYVSSVLGSI